MESAANSRGSAAGFRGLFLQSPLHLCLPNSVWLPPSPQHPICTSIQLDARLFVPPSCLLSENHFDAESWGDCRGHLTSSFPWGPSPAQSEGSHFPLPQFVYGGTLHQFRYSSRWERRPHGHLMISRSEF